MQQCRVVAHAGGVGLRMLADRTGLTEQLSRAVARRRFVPVHDRGRVLVDLAVMLADGGEAIADIDVLRHQAHVFGPVASARALPSRILLCPLCAPWDLASKPADPL